MRKIIVIQIIACTSLLLSSCEELIIETDEKNTPQNNFQLLWEDLDKHYALFVSKKVDWDSLHKVYRPQVTSNTTEQQLWVIMTKMLNHLNDGHTTLENPESQWSFESGDSLNLLAEEEFDIDLVQDKYLEYYSHTTEPSMSYGKIKDKDIGYIYMNSMTGLYPSRIDEIVDALQDHKAIIFDIRNNGGGEDDYAHRIAGAFADGEHLVFTIQTRNGENYSDFDEKVEVFTKRVGDQQYLKPVIILTDRYVASAAETFLLDMLSFQHIRQVGDTTAGDFSNVSNTRFLPNGWIYKYSHQLVLLPDGKNMDGVGIHPEVYIKNTKSDIDTDTDLVMNKAIDYLWEEYGIK
ncbi:MAG: S41 family peptidase [Chryseolinea sp.]